MKTAIAKFLRDEEGATAIEYGLIASLIAVALVASFTGLKTAIAGVFTDIVTALNAA